ncbi:MAG TPA: hypothetical protein VMT91_06355, partial [Anaerolineales bacterium]|nr:hypothetical protein [Anaerolineales bacterium]
LSKKQSLDLFGFFRIDREMGRISGCVSGCAAHPPKNSVFIPPGTQEPLFEYPSYMTMIIRIP